MTKDAKSVAKSKQLQSKLPKLHGQSAAAPASAAVKNAIFDVLASSETAPHKKDELYTGAGKVSLAQPEKLIASKRARTHEQSNRIGRKDWMTKSTSSGTDKRARTEHTFEDSRLAVEEKSDATASFNPRGFTNTSIDKAPGSSMTQSIDEVVASIMTGSRRRPKGQEAQFLRHFVERLKLDYLESHESKNDQGSKETMLDVVHGVPGSDKTSLIRWICQLMEKGLGWKHGVQFMCLNILKAEGWSATAKKTGNKHNRTLRVIIIDEVPP